MMLFQSGNLRGAEMRRLRRQLRLTRWGLWAEQVARAFWPVFVVLCLAAAMALLGAFAAAGPTGHRVLLGVFAVALVVSLVAGGALFRRPDDATVRARLDSTDPRRPLATMADELAVGRGQDRTESVWRAHRLRAAAAAARLTAGWPDLRLSTRDRWALRLFAPVLLIGGLIGTNGEWGARIATIADPAPMAGGGGALPDRVAMAEAWAVPPAYTGMGTVYLTREHGSGDAAAAPVRLPQGSEITIRVTDAGEAPVLTGGEIAGITGFRTLGGGLAEATGILSGSGELAVAGPDGELARWPVEMIPDAPPSIALDGDPVTTLTRALDIGFTAADDHGVVSAWAEMAPEGHDPEDARGLPLPVISFGLPLPITGDMRTVADHAIRDFTSHPWAGAEVVLRLYAEDGAGQVASTEPLAVTIPGRRFSNPMARALVEQRRELALDYGHSFRVLDVLQAVTRRPDDIFERPGVYLTVRAAIRRLAYGVGTETVAEVAPNVVELLWAAALALEDGDLSSALERLRTAQDRLREALESGSDEDIRQAMDELRAAMDEYLQQLAQQMMNQPPDPNAPPMDPDQMLSRQDLQEMLDRMQEQAESGLRDQARDMLSQLQQMLENLQAAQQGSQPGQGQQAMQELQEMIQQQRDLSDRTFDELRQRRREQQLGQGQQGQGQQGQQPGQQQPGWGEGQGRGDEHGRFGQGQQGEQGQGEGSQRGQPGQGGLAGEQEALRRQLDELARGLGNGGEAARRALEEAARSMGQARDDLQAGANSEAVRDQMDALDRLNEGAEALAQELQEQGQGEAQAQGDRQGRGQGQDQTRNDPFDRPTSSYGALDGRSTKVPDQALVDRARELMRELRRRSAEPSRPQLELEYFERLLDRF